MALLFNSTIFNILGIATNYKNSMLDLTQNFLNLDRSATDLFQNLFFLAAKYSSANDVRYMNSSELIKSYGYPAEEYTVKSGTGYLLNVVRMPRAGPPVLLVHGFTLSSDAFITSGKKSLACILFDSGYDVWLINCRGNVYSRRHISLSPDDPAFWKFSFHEIGTEDLPATIDFILDKTNRTKLTYIGHSQGTTSAYILFSQNPEYNNKVSVIISLSPVAWMTNIFSPLFRIAAKNRGLIEIAVNLLNINECSPSDNLTNVIMKDIFGSSPLTAAIYDIYLFLLFGFSFSHIDFNQLQNQISHSIAGSSIYQALHYLQLIDSVDFKQYDYGKVKNLKVYGLPVPPAYPVEEITCKMYFFFSNADWLCSYVDLQKLTARVQNVMGEHRLVGFNHMDYLWAWDASDVLYLRILAVIQSAN